MSDTELDLTHGDPDAADAAEARSTRRRPPRKSSSSGSSGGSTSKGRATAASKVEANIASRLDLAFEKVADALASRDDEELASAIRDEKAVMAQCVMSLTRAVTWLRTPVLVFLSAVEVILAFGRVGGILVGRYVSRRERLAYERATADANQPDTVVPPGVGVYQFGDEKTRFDSTPNAG